MGNFWQNLAEQVTQQDDIVDSSEALSPTDDNDIQTAGSDGGNDSPCIPAGLIGPNPDSLPKGSIKIAYALEFIGEVAIDDTRTVGICKKTGAPFIVQKAYGELTLYKTDKNGNSKILTVNAISGSGGMGVIPNTDYAPGKTMQYYCGKLESPSSFSDGKVTWDPKTYKILGPKEHTWKINIYENFIHRGAFRIHPVGLDYKGIPSNNDGCISPYGVDVVRFYEAVKDILANPKSIMPLTVDIKGNYNYTRYLFNQNTGKYDENYIKNK